MKRLRKSINVSMIKNDKNRIFRKFKDDEIILKILKKIFKKYKILKNTKCLKYQLIGYYRQKGKSRIICILKIMKPD